MREDRKGTEIRVRGEIGKERQKTPIKEKTNNEREAESERRQRRGKE